MWEYKQEYTQNVCWINKWKWQFEPQIWNCVTCNRHHWQTFSTSCVLSPIGGCWVILAVHMGPRHALLASSSFFIIFEYHCNLRVGTWQALLNAFKVRPCVSGECKEATLWTSMSLRLSSFVFPSFCYSYSFLIPQTIFDLKPWQLLHPHIFTVPFYSLPVLSQST